MVTNFNDEAPVRGTGASSWGRVAGYFSQVGIPVLRFFANVTGLEFELVVV